MNKSNVIYAPRSDATAESELSALAAVYAFILEAHASKKATKQSSQDDAQGDKEPPLQPVVAQRSGPLEG